METNISRASRTLRGGRVVNSIQDVANDVPLGLVNLGSAMPGRLGIWAKVPPTVPVFKYKFGSRYYR